MMQQMDWEQELVSSMQIDLDPCALVILLFAALQLEELYHPGRQTVPRHHYPRRAPHRPW